MRQPDDWCDTDIEIIRLTDELNRVELENKKLVNAAKVLKQTVMEVRHAQDQGANWYTNGVNGLFNQVRHHLNKAESALETIGML